MSMITKVGRTVLRTISPRLHELFSRRRNTRLCERMDRIVIELTGGCVSGGPFRGMKYVTASCGSALSPKLIGSYEEEIQPWIEAAVAGGYHRIIDIGCAEGYYAVGFAMRMPEAKVVAFDISEEARKICSQLSRLNGVGGQVAIRGACDVSGLNSVLEGRCLVVCDCEGAEVELLDPVKVNGFVECDLIIETHDFLGIPSSSILKKRFDRSHTVECVESIPRDPSQYPILENFGRKVRCAAVDELRPGGQQWLLMKSRSCVSK